MTKSPTPEELAEQLDRLLYDNDAPTADADPLMQAAARFTTAPQPTLSAEAKARIRAKVVQSSTIIPIQATHPLPWVQWAAAAVIAVVLGAGVFLSAANSIPGDTLYPVKKQIERIETVVQVSERQHFIMHLNKSQRRLEEYELLKARGIYETDLLTDALYHLSQASEIQAKGILNNDHSAQVDAMLEQYAVELDELIASDTAAPEDIILLQVTLDTLRGVPQPLAAPIEPTVTETVEDTSEVEVDVTETPAASPAATSTLMTAPTEETRLLDTEIYPYTAYIYSNGNLVNIRAAGNLSADILTALEPDAAIQVIGSSPDGTWLEIITTDGVAGWIASNLTSESPLSSTLIEEADDVEALESGESTVSESADNAASTDGDTSTSNNATTADTGAPDNNGNDNPGDFGCDQPGNACNAPGQTGNTPGQGGDNPGQSGSAPGQSNNDNSNSSNNSSSGGGNSGGGNSGGGGKGKGN